MPSQLVDRSGSGRCVVCGGTSGRVVWRENAYEARLCDCGAIYIAPEPPDGEVDPTVDLHPGTFYALPAALKVRWIARTRPSGALVEVGCGDGHFLEAARAAGYEIAGVEPQPERARRVSERLGITVKCALIEDLDWPDARFDIVYHCDLLSHFPDPVAALRRMSALLRPGGVLVFEVGVVASIAQFWYRLNGSLDLPNHRWLYSEDSLTRLLAQSGLRIERTKHFGLAPEVLFRSLVHQAGEVLRSITGNREPSGASAPASHPGWLERFYERVHMFLRYRLGAIAPRVGPGTLLVVARRA